MVDAACEGMQSMEQTLHGDKTGVKDRHGQHEGGHRKNPRQTPLTIPASVATIHWPVRAAWRTQKPAAIAPTPEARPSILSRRLKALTTKTNHRMDRGIDPHAHGTGASRIPLRTIPQPMSIWAISLA